MPDHQSIELDGYIATGDVENLTGFTRRWIAELIKAGRFPPPDAPGRIGSAHRWRRSTIKRALDEMATAAAQRKSETSRTPTAK